MLIYQYLQYNNSNNVHMKNMYDSLLAVVCDLHENMESLFDCGNFDRVQRIMINCLV